MLLICIKVLSFNEGKISLSVWVWDNRWVVLYYVVFMGPGKRMGVAGQSREGEMCGCSATFVILLLI